jgi:hypothetical protein
VRAAGSAATNWRAPPLTFQMHLPQSIRHMHAIAEKGEAPETPLILIGELLVFLVPLVVVMLALGFGLYYALGGG